VLTVLVKPDSGKGYSTFATMVSVNCWWTHNPC